MITKIAIALISIPSLYSFSFLGISRTIQSKGLQLQMSSNTENYLNDLQPITTKHRRDFINVYEEFKLKDAQILETNRTEIYIDTIFLNIYKLDTLFFNSNSTNIILKLRDHMQDVFFCEKQTMYRLPNTTRLRSKAFSKFIVSEMDHRVDAILYKYDNV